MWSTNSLNSNAKYIRFMIWKYRNIGRLMKYVRISKHKLFGFTSIFINMISLLLCGNTTHTYICTHTHTYMYKHILMRTNKVVKNDQAKF